MSAKPVQTVEKHDGEKEPLRFDPSRGYLLCFHCWNGNHFAPPYRDAQGIKRPKTAKCDGGGCSCGCRPEFKEKRPPRFTGEGQTSLLTDDYIIVGPKAAELQAQLEALKK
jgi:hypothetical protein